MSTVRYIDLGSAEVGQSARLIPLDHPKASLNHAWIRTSTVKKIVAYKFGPIIETQNSIYMPADRDPTPDGRTFYFQRISEGPLYGDADSFPQPKSPQPAQAVDAGLRGRREN